MKAVKARESGDEGSKKGSDKEESGDEGSKKGSDRRVAEE